MTIAIDINIEKLKNLKSKKIDLEGKNDFLKEKLYANQDVISTYNNNKQAIINQIELLEVGLVEVGLDKVGKNDAEYDSIQKRYDALDQENAPTLMFIKDHLELLYFMAKETKLTEEQKNILNSKEYACNAGVAINLQNALTELEMNDFEAYFAHAKEIILNEKINSFLPKAFPEYYDERPIIEALLTEQDVNNLLIAGGYNEILNRNNTDINDIRTALLNLGIEELRLFYELQKSMEVHHVEAIKIALADEFGLNAVSEDVDSSAHKNAKDIANSNEIKNELNKFVGDGKFIDLILDQMILSIQLKHLESNNDITKYNNITKFLKDNMKLDTPYYLFFNEDWEMRENPEELLKNFLKSNLSFIVDDQATLDKIRENLVPDKINFEKLKEIKLNTSIDQDKLNNWLKELYGDKPFYEKEENNYLETIVNQAQILQNLLKEKGLGRVVDGGYDSFVRRMSDIYGNYNSSHNKIKIQIFKAMEVICYCAQNDMIPESKKDDFNERDYHCDPGTLNQLNDVISNISLRDFYSFIAKAKDNLITEQLMKPSFLLRETFFPYYDHNTMHTHYIHQLKNVIADDYGLEKMEHEHLDFGDEDEKAKIQKIRDKVSEFCNSDLFIGGLSPSVVGLLNMAFASLNHSGQCIDICNLLDSSLGITDETRDNFSYRKLFLNGDALVENHDELLRKLAKLLLVDEDILIILDSERLKKDIIRNSALATEPEEVVNKFWSDRDALLCKIEAAEEIAERQRAEEIAGLRAAAEAERQRAEEIAEIAESQRAEEIAELRAAAEAAAEAERQRAEAEEIAERQRAEAEEIAERQRAEAEAAERQRAEAEAAERQRAEAEAAERQRAEAEAAERQRAEAEVEWLVQEQEQKQEQPIDFEEDFESIEFENENEDIFQEEKIESDLNDYVQLIHDTELQNNTKLYINNTKKSFNNVEVVVENSKDINSKVKVIKFSNKNNLDVNDKEIPKNIDISSCVLVNDLSEKITLNLIKERKKVYIDKILQNNQFNNSDKSNIIKDINESFDKVTQVKDRGVIGLFHQYLDNPTIIVIDDIDSLGSCVSLEPIALSV